VAKQQPRCFEVAVPERAWRCKSSPDDDARVA
jgi:hypothetical protein